MLDLSEENIARLLTRDAQQLADRAREIGVTAYTQKPVHRLRPNEQFLQATLRNVESGNRRVEENMMWRQRRAELAGKTSNDQLAHSPAAHAMTMHASIFAAAAPLLRTNINSGHGPRSQPNADASSHASKSARAPDAHSAMDTAHNDAAVMQLLSSKPVRGRGGIGSRVGETGPYLPAEANTGQEDNEAAASSARVLGPDCPDWVRQASGNVEVRTADSSHSMPLTGDPHMSIRARDMPVQPTIAKRAKKTKKHKKKHKHKHKSAAE